MLNITTLLVNISLILTRHNSRLSSDYNKKRLRSHDKRLIDRATFSSSNHNHCSRHHFGLRGDMEKHPGTSHTAGPIPGTYHSWRKGWTPFGHKSPVQKAIATLAYLAGRNRRVSMQRVLYCRRYRQQISNLRLSASGIEERSLCFQHAKSKKRETKEMHMDS